MGLEAGKRQKVANRCDWSKYTHSTASRAQFGAVVCRTTAF